MSFVRKEILIQSAQLWLIKRLQSNWCQTKRTSFIVYTHFSTRVKSYLVFTFQNFVIGVGLKMKKSHFSCFTDDSLHILRGITCSCRSPRSLEFVNAFLSGTFAKAVRCWRCSETLNAEEQILVLSSLLCVGLFLAAQRKNWKTEPPILKTLAVFVSRLPRSENWRRQAR